MIDFLNILKINFISFQLFNHRTKKHTSFVIYDTVDQAKDALATYHGYQMDHEHKLQVSFSSHEMAYCD